MNNRERARRRALTSSLAVCAALLATGGAGPVQAGTLRPYTIDEMLKTESFGPGAFDPAGETLVFVQKPPYGHLPDYSLPFWAPVFGRLMVTTSRGDGPAKPLFAAPADAVYALIGLSPDGRFVAFLQARAGVLSLGVFDRRTGATRIAAEPPEQDLYHQLTPIWTDAKTLVFAVRDATQPGPYSPYLQRASGEAFYRAWRRSWEGREPSASVYTSRADGGANPPYAGALYAFDAGTGQSHKLADGLYSDLRLSADGRYLCGLRQFLKSQAPAEGRAENWTYGRTRLTVFDLTSGRRIDVAPDLDVFWGTVEWSPSADRFAFFAWPAGQTPREGRVFIYDVAAGRLQTRPHTGLDLVNEREFGPPGRPLRLLWMGTDVAVAARPNPPGVATPRFTERGVNGHDMNVDPGRFDWYLLRDAAPPRNLTAGFHEVSPWAAGVTAKGAFLALDGEVRRLEPSSGATALTPGVRVQAKPLARSGARSETRDPFESVALYAGASPADLVAVDLAAGRARTLPRPGGDPELIAISPATGALAYRSADADGTDLKVQAADGRTWTAMRINGFLAEVAKPLATKVTYPGADGKPLSSCLTLPADYQPGRRYPTLVYVYPQSTPPCATRPDLQGPPSYENRNILLSHGYILLRVANPDISTREGGPLAGIVAATDRAVDATIAAGYADPDRLALIGASGAGYSGLWIAGHSRRYKALISINGIANLQSHYFTTGLSENFFPQLDDWDGESRRYEGLEQFGIGLTPWQDNAFYWRISPIAYTKAIDAPVLLVGTDMDSGGFSRQYDEMFVALHRMRKTVDYVKYWGEAHGPASAANVRDLTERTLAWLDRYVGPGPK
jgi:dipeptidyl aminopeptidase/acylaminoacyl peptidase